MLPTGALPAASTLRRLELLEERFDLPAHRQELLAKLGGVTRVEIASAARLHTRALELLLGARDREALAIEELANAHQVLHVAPGGDALALCALGRPDGAKLALPVAQHVRLDPDELGDLSAPEVQLRRQRLATGV